MRSKKTVLLAVLVVMVLVIGCGPSEKEVALTENIEELTATRNDLQTRLDKQSAELERIKATPAGMLCVARLVVPAEGIADADDNSLQEAEGLYQATFEAYPDDELCKEAKKTHKEIREERGQRAVESYTYLNDGTRKATDKQLEEAERTLETVRRDFEDTKAAKEAKRLLGKIESEWNYRGKPVAGTAFAANSTKYSGQTVRIPGKLEYFTGGPWVNKWFEMVYEGTQFVFEGSSKCVTWYAGELIGAEFIFDLAKVNTFLTYAHNGTKGEIVLRVNADGSFLVKRVIIKGDTFEFH